MNKTTGPLLVNKLEDQEIIFRSWQSPLPIMVHAEGVTVEVAIKLAKKYQKRLHVCHVAFDQLQSIEKARKEGLKITCEVCPHHLFLNKNDIRKLGPLGIMKPPLLSRIDQLKLWENLDKIDMISTDHAPHTLDEKFNQSSLKFGVPGLETTLSLMISAVHRGLLSIARLIEMTSTNPRRIFHLPHQPNTYVLVDSTQTFKISSKKLFTRCNWTPFIGLKGKGRVKKVVLRDKTVFENDNFVVKPSGRTIYPHI